MYYNKRNKGNKGDMMKAKKTKQMIPMTTEVVVFQDAGQLQNRLAVVNVIEWMNDNIEDITFFMTAIKNKLKNFK